MAEVVSTERLSRDRPAKNPGGCECEECGCLFIGEEWHNFCRVCVANVAERLWQAQQEEPTYRGGEYEASVQRELAEARKLK